MWGGRFAEGPGAVMREINASIPFDKALWRQDIAASKAHVAMLGACGIVSSEDARTIEHGLDQVAAEYERDGVPEDWALEDIHMTVESRLAELIGPAAGRLHTARTEHRDVRLAGGDVLPPQRLVERDRGVNLAHDRARPFGKAPAPHPVGARHVPLVPGFAHSARPRYGGVR